MAETETAIEPAAPRGLGLPLAVKFFLGSAFLIALAVGTAIAVTYVKGERIVATAVHDSLATSSAVQKEFEQSRLQELQLKVQLIAADPATARYVSQAAGSADEALPGLSEGGPVDTKSIADLLRERQGQYDFDLGIVLDPQGNVLGRTDQTEAFRESLAKDPLVHAALQSARPFGDYWRQDDKLYQAAIMPLAQDRGLVGFVLLAQSVNDALCAQVAKVSGAQIAFWLPSGKGPQLVASSFDEGEAKALHEALATRSGNVVEAMSAGKPMEQLPLQFAGQTWGAQLTPTEEGVGKLGAVLSLTSTDRIAAGYHDILRWVVIGGLITMLIALLLSYLLAKGILRPVGAMAQAAEQAAAGNYATHLGLVGSDEVARLSRAFDSLLSDLREKRDMEGYVGNLSRFLPDPAREQAALSTPRVQSSTATPQPARREELVLLGLEFRDLAVLDKDAAPDAVLQRVDRFVTAIDAAAGGRSVRQSLGGRYTLGFAGEARWPRALQALAAADRLADGQGLAKPAAALTSGSVVFGDAAGGAAMLGTPAWHLDRLLCESAPGRTLLTRQCGDEIKAVLGAEALQVVAGALTGKRYYALAGSALEGLVVPSAGAAVTAEAADAATQVPPQSRVRAATPRRDLNLAMGTEFGGRYRILSRLGSGGMGVVYKAHDLELDDVVALKMFKPGALVDEEQLERLKSEIKLARKITHPNVLRTFDFGEIDGNPYISMEYVRGLTLRYLINETQRIPYSAGLRIARQLCAGLSAAHEVGVLHRDIKPENIILEQAGNARLMDFGIARPIRRGVQGQTQPGTFVGTPRYSPPEQLAGEELDQRADIYSCGVLLCEMFCGNLPFGGANTMEIYIAQTQQEPVKPSTYWADIPPLLESIILRCVQRRPEDRYPSVAELGQEISQLRA